MLISTLKDLENTLDANKFESAVELCVNCIKNEGKILFAGNGGSAADSQHLAAEFTGRFVNDRKPLPALALTTDTSALTAISNDFGVEQIFSRQLEALATTKDVFIAISTSGNSKNILPCLKWTKEKGIKSILFSGENGGQAKYLADINFLVPSLVTARIQEAHILLGHTLIEETELKLKNDPNYSYW